MSLLRQGKQMVKYTAVAGEVAVAVAAGGIGIRRVL